MKIDSLRIANFRGIGDVTLESLGTMVIIAGPNGSGKSCIFDAVRLLKSIYGGYQANEWQQWMGEFHVNLASRATDYFPIFNDRTKELRISCGFRLAEDERRYISANADELLREHIWRTLMPEAYAWGGLRLPMFATQFREREPEVGERVSVERPLLAEELSRPTIQGEIVIRPGDVPEVRKSVALSVAFSTFRPQQLGVIDYHGAQRHYGRENVQGINLSLDASQQNQSQHALYNYANKYNNVKSEMAASYVKEILAEQAGLPKASQSTLTNTLKELFETFFPEKTFSGPVPTTDGTLTFPVRTASGGQHDLDDLSSGEKEILYGYLRIRNSAPRYSIILVDEPELHLNPKLIRGLPQFYRRNLAESLENQIWLVTHSDALLREVVGRDSYNVFHMLPQTQVRDGGSQLRALSVTADLDLALADLVGDLATFRPGGKVVIVEGGGDSDFDLRAVSRLVPEMAEQVNLLSGTNKTRVRSLLELLTRAEHAGIVPFKCFSITDRDSDSAVVAPNAANALSWDVYHIENYFLEPKYISRVLSALHLGGNWTDEQIWDELRECATLTIPSLVRHELSFFANGLLINALEVKSDPKQELQASAIRSSVENALRRITAIESTQLSDSELTRREQEIRARLTASIADGSWTSSFRGRDVLKRFVARSKTTVSYEVFRNLILSHMADDGYCPPGLRAVVQTVLDG